MTHIMERLRKKADKKHGDNASGQYLFWSVQALKAFPSSPFQKACVAEYQKWKAKIT